MSHGTKPTFLNARIDGYSDAKPSLPMDALVGKHILYRHTQRD
jgi:hypothetical protein